MASNHSDTNNANDIVADAQPESPNDKNADHDENPSVNQAAFGKKRPTEEELKWRLPPHLRDNYWIHLLIIHAKVDRDDAKALKESIIENVKFCGGLTPIVDLLSDVITDFSFNNLDEAFQRSTYILMYVTKKFSLDSHKLSESHACQIEALEHYEGEKVIKAVHTCLEQDRGYKLPMMLDDKNPLYDFSETFTEDVTKLLEYKSLLILTNKRSLEEGQRKFYDTFWKGFGKEV